ncbi:MAG: tetratricopeptide repeat protein [Proteobacteria bacterium]|nr:tetratricopeptide repeat protein [Pseudomonadota bacterium]
MANIQKLLSKGLQFWQQNDLLQARNTFKKILKEKPNHFEAKSYCGVLDLQLGDFEQGIHLLKSALKASPNDENLKKNINNGLIDFSNKLIKEEKYDLAELKLKEAISLDALNLNAHINFFKLANHTGNYKSVDEIYNQGKNISHSNYEFHYYYANTLFDQKKYDEALGFYEYVLKENTNFVECIFHQALCYDCLNQKKEALEKYQLALHLKPDYSLAKFNLAIFYLSINDFSTGWQNYKIRWSTQKFINKDLKSTKPILDRLPLREERILIWAEQGIGDQVLYLSLLNDFSKLNSNLIISVDKRLIKICERSFEKLNFIPQEKVIDETLYDVHLPMGDLGIYVRNSLEDFQNQKKQFLFSDKNKKLELSQRLSKDKKLACGLSWTSMGAHSQSKSINLNNFENIFKKYSFNYVNLEYVDNSENIKKLKEKFDFDFDSTENIDKFNDLDSLAALISSCDFIITISNVTAHFAGALGIKTFLLVPYGAGRIWYWSDESFSKWYPSIQILKQDNPSSWDLVFGKLENELLEIERINS